MADRRSVFSDERVVSAARGFVCAADEVWRLQRGSDPDCVFFQKMVNKGERITDRGSRQGLYVCAASGELLARTNTRNIEAILGVLERGRAAFEALPSEKRALAAGTDLKGHRWENSYPSEGLALVRIARNLTAAGLAADPIRRWNRDYAWFSGGEVRALVPRSAAPGDSFDWPLVAERLARFHVVDNVQGQTLPYAEVEVSKAELRATVTSVTAGRATLALRGTTRAASGPWQLGHNLWKPGKDIPHGIECTLLGRAELDLETDRFVSFELVALGRRWGRTQMNGRGRDASPNLIGFHFALAPPEPRIAPTFVAVYDADWIAPPPVPTWLDSPAECGLELDR